MGPPRLLIPSSGWWGGQRNWAEPLRLRAPTSPRRTPCAQASELSPVPLAAPPEEAVTWRVGPDAIPVTGVPGRSVQVCLWTRRCRLRAPRASRRAFLTTSVPGGRVSPDGHLAEKAHPAKAGAAKPRVLASFATPPLTSRRTHDRRAAERCSAICVLGWASPPRTPCGGCGRCPPTNGGSESCSTIRGDQPRPSGFRSPG
jgi:hypothetical protein